MKSLVKSYCTAICAQVDEAIGASSDEGKEQRLLLPSLPANAVLKLGQNVEEHIASSGSPCRFLFKVAYALGQEWKHSDDGDQTKAFKVVVKAGWYDEEDHLTAYRNITRTASDEPFVLVLVGTDRVVDQASLSDFFTLNLRALWCDVMGESFDAWLRELCDEKHIACEDEEREHIDIILRHLVSDSLADLPRISNFLDSLDTVPVQDGVDLREQVLLNLRSFGLPVIRDFVPFSEKRLGILLSRAVGFFSYSEFLEPRNRKASRKQISDFREELANDTEELSPQDYTGFASVGDFLDGLDEYIHSGARVQRERLFGCDFATIAERILRKRKSKKSTRTTVPKLAGQPIEVFLRAAWITLGDFKQDCQNRGEVSHESLRAIAFDSTVFRHDMTEEDSEEDDTPVDVNQHACDYLGRLVGGIDRYLEEHISLNGLSSGVDVSVQSKLAPAGDAEHCELSFKPAKTGEPRLRFKVAVMSASELKTERTFEWRLPRTHAFRTALKLYDWAYEQFESGKALPVFRIPHYAEMMHSADPEDLHRILLQAITSTSSSAKNLLSCEDVDSHDPLYVPLSKLASAYVNFVGEACSGGLYHSLNAPEWDKVQSAYEAASNAVVHAEVGQSSEMSPLLFRAFFVVSEQKNEDEAAYWRPYEPSALITALHPALLEIVRHQAAYLLSCFDRAIVEALRSSSPRAFRRVNWDSLVDLARIECPLPGLLTDGNGRLNTNVSGETLLHKLGDPPKASATLTTRLLMRYETGDEGDLPDSHLFASTRESTLILRTMRDYAELHPYARDAMSIVFFVNDDIQPAIAGLDEFLREITDLDTVSRAFHLHVSFFSEIADDSAVSRYVREWQERWSTEAGATAKPRYSRCDISVAHRLIDSRDGYQQFGEILRGGFDCDLFFLINFIRAGHKVNQLLSVPRSDVRNRMLLFPILQRTGVAKQGGGQHHQRQRILSNRQFPLSAHYTDLLACMRNDTPLAPGTEILAIGVGDFGPWSELLDEVHQVATWVVCMDPCIDEHLISKEAVPGASPREVIGFGSGVGAHGEQNYTISTEHTRPAHIRKRLAARIQSLLGPWDNSISEGIASCVWNETKHLSGMSLIRATGLSDYVRDYAAYGLVRRLLGHESGGLCRVLVSLDAFRHWFDSDAHRPDLLWLTVVLREGRCEVDAHLMECKLANKNDRYIETAWMQLKSGLDQLVPSFMPRGGRDGVSDGDRPDQRFWWLQLHRLIASHTLIPSSQERTVTAALENLAEGCFSIRWRASAITFWTDSDAETMAENSGWDYCTADQTMPIRLFEVGRHFVRRLCTEDGEYGFPPETKVLSFGSADVSDHTPAAHIDELPPEEAGVDDTKKPIIPGGKSGAIAGKDTPSGVTPSPTEPSSGKQHIDSQTITVPDRLMLGYTLWGHREVFWEYGHPDLGNRHLLIFGTSGMGKTYTVQCLLLEMGLRSLNSLIVDYTDGFTDNQLEPEISQTLNPTQHIVRLQPLPINVFRQQTDTINGQEIAEQPAVTAQRVTGVFSEVYSFGDQQKSALYQAVKQGIESGEGDMSLGDLLPRLEVLKEEGGTIGSSAGSVISKLQPFIDLSPFGTEDEGSWARVFSDHLSRIHILQMAGFGKDACRLMTEFALFDLYSFYRTRGSSQQPRVVVLDEIQNLDHRLESPLGKFLTEGRKFGMSLVLATQTLSNLAADQRDRLFQASHKLFFKPAETEVKSYATILAGATQVKQGDWVKRLSQLKKGECWSMGPSLNPSTEKLDLKAFKIKISPLSDRIARPERSIKE